MSGRCFWLAVGLISGVFGLQAPLALAQQHQGQHGGSQHGAASEDTRLFVKLPEPMGSHMLANMRDHLAALEEIQAAIGKGDLVGAGKISEARLGMTSLQSHGAAHVAQFMPEGMREAGTGMHRAASRFTLVAADAEVKGDLKPVFAALSEITRQCVGCHAGYRTR